VRIGLDFDNTIVRYDHVFALESIKLGLMTANWSGSKQELRDELQSRPDGERLWKALQGRVYGSGMKQAVMFPGVAPFLMRSRERGDDIFIVSHKTEFGHFDSTKTPLRQAALAWMESKGFFKKNRFGLTKENVFFATTRSEKVEQIARLNLDVFIDDLEEVFAEEGFPPINKVLFNVKAESQHHDLHCNSWSEIGKQILGPMPDAECKALAQTFCPEQITSVSRFSGGGNSGIYYVLTKTGTAYALKSYPDLFMDPRPRLRNEVQSCGLLEHLGRTPRAIAYDEELNLALFEWIDGEAPETIETTHIDQALDFSEKLKELVEGSDNDFRQASEACLSASQLLSQVQGRIQKLESIDNLEVQNFLKISIKPLWEEIREWSTSKWPTLSFQKELPPRKQTLSPSDFGFHNSLQRRDGSLCFVDLEYFGRDDPVKLIADFLWHPAMNLRPTHKAQWLEGMFAIFDQDPDLPQRFRAAWPLYGMRWALIMLNEFRQDGWQKRSHAKEELQANRKQSQQRQLQKAVEICGRIRRENMECPYV
jgi:hypothetical protein